MKSLTFCDKVVILLNGLLVKSLVNIHLEHLSGSVKIMPLRHHYRVDDHWIVLMLDSHDWQWRRHLIFRWALGTIALIVTMIDNLYRRTRRDYLVDWLKCNTVSVGCKLKRKKEREGKKLKIHSTTNASGEKLKKLIYHLHARSNFLHDNIIQKEIVRKRCSTKKTQQKKRRRTEKKAKRNNV